MKKEEKNPRRNCLWTVNSEKEEKNPRRYCLWTVNCGKGKNYPKNFLFWTVKVQKSTLPSRASPKMWTVNSEKLVFGPKLGFKPRNQPITVQTALEFGFKSRNQPITVQTDTSLAQMLTQKESENLAASFVKGYSYT